MRIQHINLASGWRGGERQTLLLMQGLRELGIESTLLARAGGDMAQRAIAAGFQVTEIQKPFLLHGARVGEGDLVHCHETRALQLAAVWKFANRRPLVTTRRVDFSPGGSRFTRWKYRRSDRVVAISRKVREVMEAWGLQPDSLTVIHSAIATERRDEADTVAALKSRFRGKRVVGTVAALVGHKDYPTLLRAAKRVQDMRSDVHFVIIGEGELRADLEGQIAELGITNVTLDGFQSDPYSYYPVFDVFALTSNEEGLGTAVLDAFLYGVPVVATVAGGIPEMVVPNETGLLCPIEDDAAVADAIIAVLDDTGLAQRLTAGARDRLEAEFTVRTMASRYAELYRGLIER